LEPAPPAPPAARLDFQTRRRGQRGVVSKRFDEIARAHIPTAAQRGIAVEVQLLVLEVASVNEVLVLQDSVHHNVARESMQQSPRMAICGPARIDIRMDNAGPATDPTGVDDNVAIPGTQ